MYCAYIHMRRLRGYVGLYIRTHREELEELINLLNICSFFFFGAD